MKQQDQACNCLSDQLFCMYYFTILYYVKRLALSCHQGILKKTQPKEAMLYVLWDFHQYHDLPKVVVNQDDFVVSVSA